MKSRELRTKSDDELEALLVSLRREQFNMRFQRASGQLEATAKIREVRRDIARILTLRTVRGKEAT